MEIFHSYVTVYQRVPHRLVSVASVASDFQRQELEGTRFEHCWISQDGKGRLFFFTKTTRDHGDTMEDTPW